MATVLVIDDEWDIRELLSDIITDSGLEVIQAENGEVALERAQGRPSGPDLAGHHDAGF